MDVYRHMGFAAHSRCRQLAVHTGADAGLAAERWRAALRTENTRNLCIDAARLMRAEGRRLKPSFRALRRSGVLGPRLATGTVEDVAAAEDFAMNLDIARPATPTATRKYMVTVLSVSHAVGFRRFCPVQVVSDATSAIRLLRNAQDTMGQSARFIGRQLACPAAGVQSRQEKDFRS